jgi:membrane fusion protein, multidrug efflux system
VNGNGWRCLLAAVTLALSGCAGERSAPVPDAGAALVGPESYAEVRRDAIATGPRISGSLEPGQQSVLRAEVAGTVVELGAEVGQSVPKGKVLARIAQPALRAALEASGEAVRAAESELQRARLEHDRTERLVRAGGLPERDLDTARNAVSAATARLEEARARLTETRTERDNATVEAPAAGVVSARPVSEGDVVVLGAPLFTIIDPASIRLEGSVASHEIGAVRVGSPVEFRVRGYPDIPFHGTVERIAPAADPVTRQVMVFVTIPDPGSTLVAGLFAEGNVVAERHEGLVVPISAVDERAEGAFVARVHEARVEHVPVQLGARDERTERVLVTGALEAGDAVLTGTARSLPSQTPVELGPKP